MTHSFSIREAIRFGWHTVKSHSAIVFQVVLTLLALQVVSAIVDKVLGDTALGNLTNLVLAVVGVFLGAGATIIALKLARHEHATYHQIWPDWKLVWRYFASGILAGLAVLAPILIGTILAIITGITTLGDLVSFSEGDMSFRVAPLTTVGITGIVLLSIIGIVTFVAALYVGLRYSMSRFEILDGAGIVDSLRKSAIITRGVKWKLVGFILVIAVMNIVGAILLLLPLLITLPISMIAMAHVYIKLRAHHHA